MKLFFVHRFSKTTQTYNSLKICPLGPQGQTDRQAIKRTDGHDRSNRR